MKSNCTSREVLWEISKVWFDSNDKPRWDFLSFSKGRNIEEALVGISPGRAPRIDRLYPRADLGKDIYYVMITYKYWNTDSENCIDNLLFIKRFGDET